MIYEYLYSMEIKPAFGHVSGVGSGMKATIKLLHINVIYSSILHKIIQIEYTSLRYSITVPQLAKKKTIFMTHLNP